MLTEAADGISVDLFRRILAPTHQEGAIATMYSNVYDLKSRTMYLYYLHDFDHVVTINLSEELRKGAHILNMPELFGRNSYTDD